MNSHINESYKIIHVIVHEAKEQVLGQSVLEMMCTRFSKAGCALTRAQEREGLGWALRVSERW